jgi:hypothetical protein
VPHFELVTVDGTVLGARELSRPDWPPGGVIPNDDEPSLRVVDLWPCDEDPERYFAVLVVEET